MTRMINTCRASFITCIIQSVSNKLIIVLIPPGITTSPVSATAGTDYQSVDQVVYFDPYETNKMVTINIFDDKIVEDPDETFTVSLTLPSPGLVNPSLDSVTVTILNDDRKYVK